MLKSNLMRVIIIAGSLLIIVGASVMGFAMVAEEENNNIEVSLLEEGTESLKFEVGGLVPGDQCEYDIVLKAENTPEYDLKFDFIEIEEGTLKNYARVKICSEDKELYDGLLSDAIENVEFVLHVDFKKGENTKFKIVYYLPLEVGNEAKNAEALFELKLEASNE